MPHLTTQMYDLINETIDCKTHQQKNPPIWQQHLILVSSDHITLFQSPTVFSLMLIEETQSNPQTFEDAMLCTDLDNWPKAMKDKIDQLEKLGIYQLEDLPMGRQAVANKWVYNTKINPGSTIQHKV